MNSLLHLSCGIIILVLFFLSSRASTGDRSYAFYSCFTHCQDIVCNHSRGDSYAVDWNQVYPVELSFVEDAVRWGCPGECHYRCMWKAVAAFVGDNQPVPQFYGKWPFLRMFGIQEPASALFSLLNLLLQSFVLWTIWKRVHHDLFIFPYWVFQYLFSINSFFWSTLFHCSDTPFTEKMDYFGALAFILVSIGTLQKRIFPRNKYINYFCPLLLASFFLRHVRYMTWERFDYGYNMMVAVASGLINCFGWLFWSFFGCDVAQQPYVLHCRITVVGILGFLSLELCDFKPVAWILDAHALWHASSILLIIPWYKFIIGDCQFLLSRQQKIKRKAV
ncbi:unnamed protein product [Calicophoron daubneyi]|uniref:Post-GPI attachment to proteins factor 3 n=1 Tax=Calicophoron daubneyi TaxID=300641 RepID=A0AAV2T6L8_CALDB